MKILIYTDSRGEHKSSFSQQLIFTEKIHKSFECKTFLCPHKWTTTLDFIQLIEESKLKPESFDKIILYTGVVEYSPRPLSNFRLAYNTKKHFFEKFLGKVANLENTYECEYSGEKTKSLVDLDSHKNIIVPYLQQLKDKLIFINTNKIVPNWEGNYLRVNPIGRPKNINIVSDYSKETLNKFSNLINLLEWNDEEVRKYTVDNMHLTLEGSEFIYKKILEFL